jgi:hypothetical protein
MSSNMRERNQLVCEIRTKSQARPLEPFHDPDVSDILVNTHKQVYRAFWSSK